MDYEVKRCTPRFYELCDIRDKLLSVFDPWDKYVVIRLEFNLALQTVEATPYSYEVEKTMIGVPIPMVIGLSKIPNVNSYVKMKTVIRHLKTLNQQCYNTHREHNIPRQHPMPDHVGFRFLECTKCGCMYAQRFNLYPWSISEACYFCGGPDGHIVSVGNWQNEHLYREFDHGMIP